VERIDRDRSHYTLNVIRYTLIFMLCDNCHKKNAGVHFTEIVNGKSVETHICHDCAKAKTQEIFSQIHCFLGDQPVPGNPGKDRPDPLRCPVCSLSIEEFKKRNIFGCGHCLLTFNETAVAVLKEIHGSAYHCGKTPGQKKNAVPAPERAKVLKEALAKAISLEEYEEAARLKAELSKICAT